jgi:hypothetical protein
MSHLSELNPEQAEALTLWRKYQLEQRGEIRWKGALKDAWMTGKYPAWDRPDLNCYLQQIRNKYGPAFLNRLNDVDFELPPTRDELVDRWQELLGQMYKAETRWRIESGSFRPDRSELRSWVIEALDDWIRTAEMVKKADQEIAEFDAQVSKVCKH